MEHAMATIVEYAEHKTPVNGYPDRIISPPRSGPCCFSDMEEIGTDREEEGRWVYRYKRCHTCGFTVRMIQRELPDMALAAEVRHKLTNAFRRIIPEY
jgi:hypothetical protein